MSPVSVGVVSVVLKVSTLTTGAVLSNSTVSVSLSLKLKASVALTLIS